MFRRYLRYASANNLFLSTFKKPRTQRPFLTNSRRRVVTDLRRMREAILSIRPIRNWVTAAPRRTAKAIFHFAGLEVIKTSTLLAFERTLAANTAQIAELQATLTEKQAGTVAYAAQIAELHATLTENQAQIAQLKHQSSNDAARIQDLTDIAAEYRIKLELRH